MTGPILAGARRARALGAVLFLVPALALPAGAAKPPEGRTYFATLFGVEAPYDMQHRCFHFTAAEICTVEGDLCGTWQRTSRRGAATSFSFQLSFLEEGTPVTLDGYGRVTTAGRSSSVGGAGRQIEGDRRFNFSFVGRETTAEHCLELVRASSDDDDGETVVGSGRTVTETRVVADFDSVSLAGVGRLVIEHTGSESLTVTADDNILPLLTSEVVGRRLRLASAGRFSTRNPIVYRLTVRQLDEILASGAAGVESDDVDTEQLRVTLAGASAAVLAGTVDHQIVSLSGACSYWAPELASRVATVELVGASVAVVRVRERLEGSVAGASRLEYYGDPQVDVTVSGASSVQRLGN